MIKGVGFLDGLADLVNEVAGVGKITIDARETYVSDFVNGAEMSHHTFADIHRGDLFVVILEDALFDFVGDVLNLIGRDGSFVARFLQTCDDLVAIIR